MAGLSTMSVSTSDFFLFFKGCLASSWFKCYECSYMNYDGSDYRCVTSPANATNVRVRECRQGAAETCVTKTVYTKGSVYRKKVYTKGSVYRKTVCSVYSKTVYTRGSVYCKTVNTKGSLYCKTVYTKNGVYCKKVYTKSSV